MTRKFDEQIEYYSRLLAARRRVFNLLGYGRLALLVLLAGFLYLLYRSATPPFFALTAVLLAATAGAWLYHIRAHEQVDLYEGMIKINRQYLDRIGGDWSGLPVDGAAFADPAHPYAADLDILGSRSLFQLLNVAGTWHGRRALAADLLEPAYPAAGIRERQRAVEELAPRTELRSRFQYHAGKVDGNPAVRKMIKSLEDPATILRSRVLCTALLWVPVLLCLLLCAALVCRWQALYAPLAILFCAQAVFWVCGLPKTNRYLESVAASPYIFRHYAELVRLLGAEAFGSPLLTRLQSDLSTGDGSAKQAMEELDSIVSKTHMRGSGVLYLLVNALLLWDYRCAVRLSRWKAKHGAQCAGWFEALGCFESLLSLSVLPCVCAATCMPAIEEHGRVVEAQALGHPLLPNQNRVCNNIAMGDEIYIISGSNMSGKTTFLRTVGVNLVLARAGGAVCADSMRCSLFRLMSSMRIADDLAGGISTFYAELRIIKRIIDAARERRDLFFLIDEIFRGTNSEDRLFGANTVIRELAGRGVMGVITTHDLTLCALEGECAGIRNYSFSEQYEGDEMRFDYKIRPGKSRTTNAKFLMRKVGILM